MKPNLVDRTCELPNDCATTESYTIPLLESSYSNIPSCSWPNHSSDVVKWSLRGHMSFSTDSLSGVERVGCPSSFSCVVMTAWKFESVRGTGLNCEVEINECDPDPCTNGGQCVDLVVGYRCVCELPFSGPNCSTQLTPCLNNRCRNGAQCVPDDLYTDYTCRCPPGFTGQFRPFLTL